ncbi:MAG: aminopeptidase [Sphaerobacter sp.]|nr:aminopeptidase [Sphaerobacter sp.]
MRDESRIERLARVLTEYSLELRPGETVVISGGRLAAPLLLATYRHALRLGALPILDVHLPEAQEILLRHGSDAQLQAISPLEEFASTQADARLSVAAAENTRMLAGIDPARQRVFGRARADLRQRHLERAARGELKWTATLFPTAAYAQEADLSLHDYAEFVFRAGFLDDPDPVARWRELAAYQQRLIDWLTPRREVHVTGPDTDLRLRIAGRTWINSDGHRNFPSGEIFTGPIEDSVEGTIRFTHATIVQGREVEDVRLWFERGRVVRATAARNQAFLEAMLETDAGARYVGEFAFGTNRAIDRFTRNILFDEKIGGTIHLALGAGYPDSGSQNQSAIHWDLICDLRQGGQVTVDGEVFLKDGEYVVGDA